MMEMVEWIQHVKNLEIKTCSNKFSQINWILLYVFFSPPRTYLVNIIYTLRKYYISTTGIHILYTVIYYIQNQSRPQSGGLCILTDGIRGRLFGSEGYFLVELKKLAKCLDLVLDMNRKGINLYATLRNIKTLHTKKLQNVNF